MSKTNYDQLIDSMTVEKLACLIDQGEANACSYCEFKDDPECGCMCNYGIVAWLQKETKDS